MVNTSFFNALSMGSGPVAADRQGNNRDVIVEDVQIENHPLLC